MRRALVLTALLAAAVVRPVPPAAAESRYSLRGDGEFVPSMRADARALGGAEAAARVPGVSGNPATLAFADRTTFYGTYDTEWIRTEETLDGAPNPERKDYSGVIPNLALVFPLPRGVRLGTGLLIARRRGGTIEQTVTVDDGSGGTLEYRQEFEGSGSFLRIPFVFGLDLGRVQVGLGPELQLLSLERRWRNDFTEAQEDLGFVDSEDGDETSLGGLAWRAGLRVPVTRWLAVGAWGALPGELSGERRLESDQAGITGDLEVDASADYRPTWAAGVDLSPRPQLRLVADWVHEAWEEADALDAASRFVNVDRWAFGLEWSPPGGLGGLDWPVRAGYRTENLHTLDTNGREVNEHVLTFGSGFGIAGGRGDIDWYLEYGWRGESDVSEYRETLVRFGVTLTGWERWTRREPPPEDDDW